MVGDSFGQKEMCMYVLRQKSTNRLPLVDSLQSPCILCNNSDEAVYHRNCP